MKIAFEDADIGSLKKKGLTCIDMHVHTRHSDGGLTVKQAIKYASKIGCGLSITDHNKIKGAIQAVKNKKDVLVVPGIEVNTSKKKDLILYFYNASELSEFYEKHIKPNLPVLFQTSKIPFEKLIDVAQDYNCVLCAPHPCGPLHKNLQKYLAKKGASNLTSKIKFFEAINSSIFRRNNLEAIEWAKKLNKCLTAGSDAHNLFDIGTSLTCASADNVEDFLGEIIAKKNLVIGNEINFARKIYTWFPIIKQNILTFRNLFK